MAQRIAIPHQRNAILPDVRRLVPALVVLGLAGCAHSSSNPSAASPTEPVRPAGDLGPWGTWAGPAIESGFLPCGLYPNAGDGFTNGWYVAMDRDGHVLRLKFLFRPHEAGNSSFEVAANLTAWLPIVKPLFTDGWAYGDPARGHAVRIVEVVPRTLTHDDARAVWDGLDNELAQSTSLRSGGCNDSGIRHMRAGGLVAEIGYGGVVPAGWKAIQHQMYALCEWTGTTYCGTWE